MQPDQGEAMNQKPTSPALIYIAWAVVLLPLAWAIWQTFIKVMALFS